MPLHPCVSEPASMGRPITKPRWLHPAGARTICAAMIILRPSISRKVSGWCLLVLGVLGMVLPFLQGFLFLVLGVFVLRDQHIWAARRWVAASVALPRLQTCSSRQRKPVRIRRRPETSARLIGAGSNTRWRANGKPVFR